MMPSRVTGLRLISDEMEPKNRSLKYSTHAENIDFDRSRTPSNVCVIETSEEVEVFVGF